MRCVGTFVGVNGSPTIGCNELSVERKTGTKNLSLRSSSMAFLTCGLASGARAQMI